MLQFGSHQPLQADPLKVPTKEASDFLSSEIAHSSRRVYLPYRECGRYSVGGIGSAQPSLLPARSLTADAGAALPTRLVDLAHTRMSVRQVLASTWSNDGRRFIAGTRKGDLVVWNSTLLMQEMVAEGHGAGISLSAGGVISHPHAIKSLSVTQRLCRGLLLSGGRADGQVRIFLGNFRALSGFVAHAFAEGGGGDAGDVRMGPAGEQYGLPVCDVALQSDDLSFATGSDDGMVKVWDTHAATLERTPTDATPPSAPTTPAREVLSFDGDVKGVDWHPSWSLLAVALGKKNEVAIADPRTGGAVGRLLGHRRMTWRVKWNPANPFLFASGSKDGSVKVWDVRMLSEYATLTTDPAVERSGSGPGPGDAHDVLSVAWHPSNPSLIAGGCADGLVRLWSLSRNFDVPPRGAWLDDGYHEAEADAFAEAGEGVDHVAVAPPAEVDDPFGALVGRVPTASRGDGRPLAQRAQERFEGANLIAPQITLVHSDRDRRFLAVHVVTWHPRGHTLVSGGADGWVRVYGRRKPGHSVGEDLVSGVGKARARYSQHDAAQSTRTWNTGQGMQMGGRGGGRGFGGRGGRW